MADKSDKAKGETRFDIEEDLSKVEVTDVLPVLPLRGIVIFPNQIHPLLVSRPASLRLIEDVGQASRVIGLSAQKNPEEENPAPEGLFPRGTAVRILKMLKYPDHSVRVLVQGIARIDLLDFVQLEPYFRANVRRLSEAIEGDKELDALQAHLVSQFSKFVSLVPYLPDELQVIAMQVREPARLTDMVASYLKIAVEESQYLLSTNDVRARLEKLIVILGREIELLELGHKIQSQVQTADSKGVLKLLIGLIGTMTALVIGLLIATAASSYVTRRSEFTQMSANVMLLDRELARYGPETKEVRDLLRRAVAPGTPADLVRNR
jgi:ATP-dependent Lon protease